MSQKVPLVAFVLVAESNQDRSHVVQVLQSNPTLIPLSTFKRLVLKVPDIEDSAHIVLLAPTTQIATLTLAYLNQQLVFSTLTTHPPTNTTKLLQNEPKTQTANLHSSLHSKTFYFLLTLILISLLYSTLIIATVTYSVYFQ